MKATETVLAWTPNTSLFDDDETKGQLAFADEQEARISTTFPRPFSHWDALLNGQGSENEELNMVLLMGMYRRLIIDEKMDPQLVDEAFLELEEFRRVVSLAAPSF